MQESNHSLQVSFIPREQWWCSHPWRNSVPSGTLENNWVLWKTSLSYLSWVSIFNLEEKKITALYLTVLIFMGQHDFQAAAPAGHCSDDVCLGHVTSRAGLWWSIAATSRLSYITASTAAPLGPLLYTPAGSPGSKQGPRTVVFTRYFLLLVGEKKKIVISRKFYGVY